GSAETLHPHHVRHVEQHHTLGHRYRQIRETQDARDRRNIDRKRWVQFKQINVGQFPSRG
ncbi:MAG: hypothetical protein ACKPKO_49830, partial [Candidatus Fonsibacter sp.]